MFGKLAKMGEQALKQAKEAVDKAQGKGKEAEKKKEEEAAAAPAEEEAKEPEGPPRLADDEAVEIAQKLRAGMKGIGTDEEALVKLLAPLNYVQAEQVVAAYTEHVERDLVKDLKSELGGKLEDTLVGLVTPPADFLAGTVRDAIKGIGSDEELVAEAVCTASDEEIVAAAKAYRLRYERILVDDVESDLDGKFKQLIVGVLRAALQEGGRPTPTDEDQIEEDVLRLYKAGEDKVGTNTKVFIEILGSNSREYVQGTLSDAYAKKYGKSLAKVVKDELGGEMEAALLALVRPVHETYAHTLHKAMKGAGSDEKTMVRVIVGQRHRLKEINEFFLAKHEKNLARWVKSEVGGNLEDALVGVIEANTE